MRGISRYGAIALAVILALWQWSAQAAEPIKIGFSMALTGGLAPNGKSALLAMQIWEKDVNAKGGLLGRPVQLVYYDDQSQPSTVPAIYTKLLDIDKVDLVVGPYATAQIAPAMPIVMQRNLVFITLLGLSVNDAFHYPRYFQIAPNGSGTKAFTKGFFDLAAAQNSEAEDDRDRLCRPAIRARQCRRRARHRQGSRPQRRLRQELSADDGRLLADRARGAGDQSGHFRDRLIPARFGRHGACHPRGELHAQDGRRRHGRLAGDRPQDAARPAAERHRQLRFLAAGPQDAVRRRDGRAAAATRPRR